MYICCFGTTLREKKNTHPLRSIVYHCWSIPLAKNPIVEIPFNLMMLWLLTVELQCAMCNAYLAFERKTSQWNPLFAENTYQDNSTACLKCFN